MTTAKGAARRTALLDAAEALLVSGGHTALSLRAVADAAGVRLGHLQYYFPSRDGLVAELLARILQRSLDHLTESATDGGSGSGTDDVGLDALVGMVLGQQTDTGLVRVFAELWALAARDESVATAVRAFYRQYVDLVADRIATHAPGLPPPERRARAEVFIALVEGASLMRSGIAGTPSAATDALISGTALAILTGK
ncbi:TetR/AcrR family transcriptional regulator [Streptomyces yaizuensis]|uniref:TetR/AcrR family transcriptional regulator n=1 Tax=Streptomyces yaizuensis TaxID=2989713 RepID=A0ABQ5NYC6_9ACTN|nr:TetR/AcrR family transcriptional regulator [Streptomyces sp. YSPA8]GLF94956.1 TetR/AcrR family transcriptional regulator [Streptomyces sp. YSPA8]